ncbi:MAG: endopeptidase La [Bacilli bacterium]|jgi:ATP-dependent Lon protease
MVKTTLPVLLLRGMVLLPHSEIKIEVSRDIDIRAVDATEKNNDNHILTVCQLDPLEEKPNMNELSKVGVIGQIKMRINLPNGKVRLIIRGINRAHIYNYTAEEGVLTSEIGPVTKMEIDPKEELAHIRKLFRTIEKHINTMPHVSNAVLSQIGGVTTASKLSDIVAFHILTPLKRKIEYIEALNPITRIKMILDDIKTEEEIYKLENKIDEELRQQLDEAQKEFVLREKIRIIKEELGDISNKDADIEAIRNKLNTLKMPDKVKERALEELKRYESMAPNSPETVVVRNYIDWLISLPWRVYTKDTEDLKRCRRILDSSHHGLEQVKERIIEYLAVKMMTNNLRSPILCFVGPPGTGKTSLAKSIAKSLNRRFVKISVGGINDEAEIVGHRRTYIGSSPGRIIQAMKKAGSSNPVFLIDEIDKMTRDIKGDPASSLLEVLDPEQNKYFSDHYIEEEYDLSKVMFIATANYLYNIPEPLRDRLEVVELSGYTEYEKLDIAKRHLLPKQAKEHGIRKNQVVIENEAILTIVRNYTKEAGVRELERLMATVLRKIVTKLVNSKKSNEKIVVKVDEIEKYLGKKKYFYNHNDSEGRIGVVNGLAYTPFGGDILPIEVTFYKGKGELVLTGSLGNTMKESARIALSYIKAHAEEFNIDYKMIEENDIHIHIPEGAIPKDGPSAGITLTTALISAFTKKPIDNTIGMTGEMTLRGNVLSIGGLKEKTIGAHRGGIKTIIIPKDNERELDEIPKEIMKDLRFIPVNEYHEVLDIVVKS